MGRKPDTPQSRAFHGRVDRNDDVLTSIEKMAGRAFHGRVDRNIVEASANGWAWVAPFTGAWIETPPPRSTASTARGRAFHGRVDRNAIEAKTLEDELRRAFHGRVDRNTVKMLGSGDVCGSRLSRARGSKPGGVELGRHGRRSRLSRARGSKRA